MNKSSLLFGAWLFCLLAGCAEPSLSGEAASNTKPVSGGDLFESEIDPRLTLLSQQSSLHSKAAATAYRGRRYEEAIVHALAAREIWKSAGYSGGGSYLVESYYALRDWDKVIAETEGQRGRRTNFRRGIALLKQGRYEDAKAMFDAAEVSSYIGEVPANFTPGDSTPAKLEASFRLALGVRLELEQLEQEALEEYEAAERLDRGNPIVSFLLARRYDAGEDYPRAFHHWQIAAQLPGPAGLTAKRERDRLQKLAEAGRIQL